MPSAQPVCKNVNVECLPPTSTSSWLVTLPAGDRRDICLCPSPGILYIISRHANEANTKIGLLSAP